MDETSKTKLIWGDLEKKIIQGSGIDIGCGNDPVTSDVKKFDIENGDANFITKYVNDLFDFVYSSHCLEHMHDPKNALIEWWKLVKPGGYLILIVPDEDLYEQGVFPSRFNPDHKSTFTISKNKSWSNVSINLYSLVREIKNAEIVSMELQDNNYDRNLLKFGKENIFKRMSKIIYRIYYKFKREGLVNIPLVEWIESRTVTVDQTLRPGVLAQIQCILKKKYNKC